MATVKTPARALLPGDIVRDPFQGAQGHLLDRAVVLAVAFADPGPVGLQLGRLGPIPKHLDRVATVSWHPEHHVEVEFPGRNADEFRHQVALGLLGDVERLAASACLMVGQPDDGPPVWLLVGTTDEIRVAAPRPAVKDHVLREVVNQLRDIALQFHATGQLRARLREALDPLLK